MPCISSLLLRTKTIVDPYDAELLLAHTLHTTREYILAHPETTAQWTDVFFFAFVIFRRRQGVPLAYLTGHQEFFGLDFLVNKHTLVPRPDTEILVEAVLDYTNDIPRDQTITLMDIGTGTACIPIAIYDGLHKKNRQVSRVYASDISPRALRVAKKNADAHQTPIHFSSGNLFSPFMKTLHLTDTDQIILTANLPYLTKEQFVHEPTIQHEPYQALVADDDGLALYKELLTQLSEFRKKEQAGSIRCFFEIDPDQSHTLPHIIRTHAPGSTVTIKKDLCGRERVVMFTL